MSPRSKTKTDKYPLPSTVDGICALVRKVLTEGTVQRLELDVDDVVRVTREVPPNEMDEPDVDWDAALRNVASFLEYHSEGASPFQVLVDMALLVANEGLRCSAFVIGANSHIEEWLDLSRRGMPGLSGALLGIPIQVVDFLPGETIILCASLYPSGDPSEVSFAVKATMEILDEPSQTGSETPDRGRSDSTELDTAADQLEVIAGGLRSVRWEPRGRT